MNKNKARCVMDMTKTRYDVNKHKTRNYIGKNKTRCDVDKNRARYDMVHAEGDQAWHGHEQASHDMDKNQTSITRKKPRP
jgi:hypothetical protein